MRNVIVSNIVTLDGFTAGEGGNPMVLNMDAAFDAYNLERMRTAGTILLGRASFELFGSFWPAVADAPTTRRTRPSARRTVSSAGCTATSRSWSSATPSRCPTTTRGRAAPR